jgi:hypothetical protein
VGLIAAATIFYVATGAVRAATEGPITVTVATVALTVGFVFVWLMVALEVTSRIIDWAGCSLSGSSPEATAAMVVGFVSLVFAGSFSTQVFRDGGITSMSMSTLVLSHAVTVAIVVGVLRLVADRRR